MKKFGKILGGIILGIVLILLAAVAILTALEYRPDQIETLNTTSGKQSISTGDSMTILTYNTGYAGLSKDEDFFMDGGSKVMPETKDLVKHNMKGIAGILNDADADVCFLQEVDIDSKRSYHINEKAYYEKALGVDGIFACNFKCVYVPYPLPTIGKVESGLVTYSDYKVSEASRIALPESFKWPVKTCNLKRCMLETRIPIKGSDKELVLINFHLEAYDSGEGKIAQRKVLVKKLKEEYEKGNYVIEEPGKGSRRVVSAPNPVKIVELDAVKALLDANQVVIAAGGGGIPVLEQDNHLRGASAVIEKDLAAGKLAEGIDAEMLIILTNVEKVCINLGQNEEPLGEITTEQAKTYMEEGHFGIYNMLPKFRASVDFVEECEGRSAYITSFDKVTDALKGKTGTVIR